jgi:hypothetical protein
MILWRISRILDLKVLADCRRVAGGMMYSVPHFSVPDTPLFCTRHPTVSEGFHLLAVKIVSDT